jgi:predicted RNA-binding Zn ribbon-like protein
MQTVAEMPLIGGNVALDFVNTAEERGHPEAGDALGTPADLRLWGERSGLLSRETGGGDGADELLRAVEARELLYSLLLARVRGRRPAKAELDRLAALVADAHRAGTLAPAADGRLTWRWSSSELSTVRHVAVTAAAELLAREPTGRLKQCPGDHCGWFFVDATKRGNRRWCTMRECGQEAKSARRRERTLSR